MLILIWTVLVFMLGRMFGAVHGMQVTRTAYEVQRDKKAL